MVKKLRRNGDASAAPPPKEAAPGSSESEKFKKRRRRRLVKADPEKPKADALESAAAADASASAPAAAATPKGVATERSRGESSRTTEKEKEKDGDKSSSGFIFMCSARTKPECYRHCVFGLPKGKMGVVEKIRPGAKLFLYDFDLKLMYGVYKATSKGGMDIVRHAFDGKFPAQVKFIVDLDCLPVPESSFKHAIKENYYSKGRFSQELTSEQVHRLLAIFKPISQSHRRESQIEDIRHPPHIVEDRRESYFYDERRPLHHVDARGGPNNVQPSLLEDRHTMLRQAPYASAPHHVPLTPELQEVPPMYYHQVAPNSSYHQPRLDAVHERTAADVTVRDPLLSRDYGPLRGDLAARSERLDELYRSYRRSTSTMGIHQDPSYVTTSYGNPKSIYSEDILRPVSTRVSGPNVPVSTRYSFPGPPTY